MLHFLNNVKNRATRVVKEKRAPCVKRYGQGDNPHEGPFLCRRHGTRVAHILPHIRAFIDARDNHIRFFRQQDPEREQHGIGGSAVRREYMIAELLDAEWLVKGNCMAYTRPFRIGGNNPYVGHRRKGFFQRQQPLGIYAIVI